MQRSIIDWLLNSTNERPDAVAVSDPNKEYTYTELLNNSKNVAAKLAKKCEVQLAYAIGVAKPVSIMVDTFGTGVIGDDVLAQIVREIFDLRPNAIIENLELRKPIYRALAAYGHMGREDLGVRWEQTDKVDALRQAAGV